jgi:N-acetylmuramoyl-L-alanine amidase
MLLLASGCGPKHVAEGPAGKVPPSSEKPSEPERPTTAPSGGQARPGYDKRVEPLKGIDTSPLRGRRIVLDPGHGGRFPGSLGVNGLTEAEVNLGVALNLWGLLTNAGAVVEMTRTADVDFATAADSSLRGDLIARTLKANAFDADVFLSIHHNADAGSRHDLNETQTYYKFSDPLASYDLGVAIHRHLTLNLGVGADRLLPGNYYVVRNSVAPAVLGESSYLTNPAVESRLALAAKQRLEAEAYFLGLLDYFRTGVPRITATRLEPLPGDVDGSERPWIVAVTDRAPGTAQLLLDGAPVDSSKIERVAMGSAWRLRARPDSALTDGRHRVEWSVRAAGGNWSRAPRPPWTCAAAPARRRSPQRSRR